MSELNQPQRAILMLKMRRHENEFMLRGRTAIAMKIVKKSLSGAEIPSRRWFLGTGVAEQEHHNVLPEEDTAATSQAINEQRQLWEVHSLGIS
ncbi:hypothetical protein [Bradyrhizobium sp. 195]|uniref:hypothetical protein n=1 Tax=Bradyrhizobium sp. 195 TaxID=2782662 RepID=UPI0020018A43|nr:hypothetical protein [Bradyrhizobium sp. 195]UPK28111.1 hypothetical protein IVB26_05950 [Bradyrhizobium sp. 195]